MKLNELKRKARQLPKKPGVYIFKAQDGSVIYVGKASNLRNRVLQYFGGNDSRPQIQFLIKKVDDLVFFETDSSDAAIILERDLIKKYLPIYNIKDKDDSGNVHITIDLSKEWPYFQVTNQPKPAEGLIFFGPLPSRRVARNLIEALRLAYPIRNCSDAVFHNRIRPCMEYELGRCLAPCVLEVSKETYRDLIKKCILALERENNEVIEILQEKLQKSAEELRFEDCILYRDVIQALNNYSSKSFFHRGETTDYISGFFDKDRFFLSILRVIGYRVIDATVTCLSFPDWLCFENVLKDHYFKIGELPANIFFDPDLELDIDIVSCVLKKEFREQINIYQSISDGFQEKIIKLAKSYAYQYSKSTHYSRVDYQILSKEMMEKLNLTQCPVRVECLDISNYGDWGICAGFSVFVEGEQKKDEYILIKLKQRKMNDLASIKQAISIRLNKEKPLFDLLVIDGGPQHLKVAATILEKFGLETAVVAIAKKRARKTLDRIYCLHKKDPYILHEGSLLHSFFANLRDEAHRLVNNFNRYLRKRSVKYQIK